jgi:hypothetical protein
LPDRRLHCASTHTLVQLFQYIGDRQASYLHGRSGKKAEPKGMRSVHAGYASNHCRNKRDKYQTADSRSGKSSSSSAHRTK